LALPKNLYENRELFLEEIEKSSKEFGESNKNIVKTILFGSILTEKFDVGSDLDILIILKNSEYERYFDRIPEFLSFFNKKVSIPVGIFPYTEDEIIRMLKTENPFIKRVLKEGKILYKKSKRSIIKYLNRNLLYFV